MTVLEHVLTFPVGVAAAFGYVVGHFMGKRASDHHRSSA